MKKEPFSTIYEEATLALFSSLNIQIAIRALYDVLHQSFPLESIVLHLVDRDKMQFHIIADARTNNVSDFRSTEIPKQLSENIQSYDQDTETTFQLVRKSENPFAKYLLERFGFLSDTIYWSYLALDKKHFGGVSLVVQPGNTFSDTSLSSLNLLKKPLTIALANALRHEEILTLRAELKKDNDRLRHELIEIKGVDVIYETSGLSGVVQNVKRVARHDTAVLVLGETGVGKEVIANSIHTLSSRKDKPFITVNCGALPENLADSHLFGYEKGAFTGANQLRKGYFERADKGTLFLDEIGELSLDVQVKLLRILETSTLERVGGQDSISVDVRVVAATHRDLVQMVNDGTFREDLWYRLNIFPIIVPPLRHRVEDIPELIRFFLSKKSRDLRLSFIPKIHTDDLQALQKYSFPGNVRELQNIIERALIHFDEDTDDYLSILTGVGKISAASRPTTTTANFAPLDDAVKSHIKQSLKLSKGRIQGVGGAAELLKLHPSTLRAKMKKLHIKR